MTRREKLSAVDTAWLRMDRPGNPMMICSVMLFGEHVRLARLRQVIAERFLRFERFRQRPVVEGASAFWEEDEHFAIEHHVKSLALPSPGRQRELQTRVSELAGTPLPPGRPLWQFHLVEHYGRGSALILRIHHCYADGIALIQVMLSMTDASPDGPPAMPLPGPRRRSLLDQEFRLDEPLSSTVRLAGKVTTVLLDKGMALWTHPGAALELAGGSTGVAREVARLALMSEDSPTRFKGHPGGRKRVAWTAPLPLDEVKAIGKALGGSVNDVLLSCVAGAFGGYLAEQGDALEDVMVRALVPVNLRPSGEAHRLGNHFGLVFLELPIGIRNPVERLYAVRSNMRALKGSYQPVVALGLLAAMGAGPKLLQDSLLEALARNATAVVTNVPGPQQPLYLAGAAIDALMFWVPQSGNIGIGASVISFNGHVQFGLIADQALCKDPERIAAGFAKAFESLVLATLLAPWPEHGELDPALVEAAVSLPVAARRHGRRD